MLQNHFGHLSGLHIPCLIPIFTETASQWSEPTEYPQVILPLSSGSSLLTNHWKTPVDAFISKHRASWGPYLETRAESHYYVNQRNPLYKKWQWRLILTSGGVREQKENEESDGSKKVLWVTWTGETVVLLFFIINLCFQSDSYISANNFGSRGVENSSFPLNWQVYYTWQKLWSLLWISPKETWRHDRDMWGG